MEATSAFLQFFKRLGKALNPPMERLEGSNVRLITRNRLTPETVSWLDDPPPLLHLPPYTRSITPPSSLNIAPSQLTTSNTKSNPVLAIRSLDVGAWNRSSGIRAMLDDLGLEEGEGEGGGIGEGEGGGGLVGELPRD